MGKLSDQYRSFWSKKTASQIKKEIESMKTLEQIQEENRKVIIMANNPEAKDYDEALEMEIEYGCKIYDLTHTFFGVPDSTEMTLISGDFKQDNVGSFLHYRGDPTIKEGFKYLLNKNDYKIIGKPLTLDRVLIAFKNNEDIHYYTSNDIFYIALVNQDPDDQIEWDLTKETLEQQSEEVQIAINEMILD